jgi:hypothetical protein
MDSVPPRLSTATFWKKDDLHYYIQAKMRELGVSAAPDLPLRVLDFKTGQELLIDPKGKTRPGRAFAPPD